MKSCPQIYVKGSLDAVALYKEAFNLTLNPDMTAFNDDGTYEHVSLMSGDNEILAVAEDSLDLHSDIVANNKKPIMAFNVFQLGTKEAVDHAYNVLSAEARINENLDGPVCPYWDEDGNEYWFGLVDKFGVYWGVGK